MITDVDEALRELLLQEIAIKGNEVDIKFDQPKREWSSRLNKPTINLFLFDLRENLRLRGSEQYRTIARPDGITEVKRNPVRMDLRYLMTAWVKEAEDEHLLMSQALMGFLRHPFLPEKVLVGRLKDQPAPVALDVAKFIPEAGPVDKFSEIWGVLDNEIRLSVLVSVTISVDPYGPMLYKQVFTRETRYVQDTAIQEGDDPESTRSLSKTYQSVGGSIQSKKYAPSTLKLLLVETQKVIDVSEEGGFVLNKISNGEYHLDVLFNDKVLKRQKIVIPSEDYDIQV